MFQILEFTEARLATLTSRSEKHGDDEKPAVSLGIELDVANTMLDTIDPTIREALFKPKPTAEDEPELPGVEASTPVLRCNSIDRVTLGTKHEGWTLAVDDGIDDTKPKTFGSCKVDKFNVEARQGGSVTLRFRIGTSDLDADRSGMLGMHVGQSIWITLKAPEPKQEAIDGTVGHPGAAAAAAGQGSLLDPDAEQQADDATSAFLGQHGSDDDNGPEDEGDGEGGDPDADSDDGGTDPDLANASAFEAGVKRELEARGVKPKGTRGRRAAAAH